ncbi:L7Ae/L30e/S12e/Gadd45 family ribosomal protein [Alkaliphilus serpentinus]|uniref:Ribosomal protein eL8/eL30/eS12/Gadd45 domain-containing protein n=1 Tax=Alkaliphilus serpentinus TaxID=1482731 RepID=A0A833MEH2_9FIRM|nr:ribosomal L7Ae/L30e/S12e/Gadd45 family protein [Alkaliphilus serpentinus]KAB3531339.1 hypothetical protein F8153_03945 [Alkaliphilus serpentinus]
MNDKIYNLLGFAMKAGVIASGEDTCRIEIRKNRVNLVLLADDASVNSKKTFHDKTTYRKIPLRIIGTKNTLGAAIGKGSRAVVAIKDKGFANKLMELIDEEGKGL